MSREAYYDVIRKPVITEKSTIASENNQVVFKVAPDANKTIIKEAVEALFDVKVKAVNTLVRKGKTKRFRGVAGKQNDEKKAIVTLEDGHGIDVTTGLWGKVEWHLRHINRPPRQRGPVRVDRSALYSGKPVKKLTEGLTKTGGRNNAGRITARRRGGGHKRSYRIIDFKRQKFDMEATVERLEYDPIVRPLLR